MNVSPRRPIFNRRPENNIYRIFTYAILSLAGLAVILGLRSGNIKSFGEPTPTATRIAESYSAEADAHFVSGDLGAMIVASIVAPAPSVG